MSITNIKKLKIILFILLVSYLFWSLNVKALGMKPVWFSWNDSIYTLEGNADIYLIDKEWRKTGYNNLNKLNEIPWVYIYVSIWTDNTDNQSIYMSERKDLKTVIIWKWNWTYNLLVAWWNYYLKIENINTSKWQIDEFIIKEDSIEINFDDNKVWNYNIMMDNFDYKDASIFYSWVPSTWDIRKYIINWDWVNNDTENFVKYTINWNIVENKINNNFSINEYINIYKILLWIIIFILFIIVFTLYFKN